MKRQTSITDEEARERRRAAEDDYLADKDYERRKHDHNWGICDQDSCEWCKEEKGE